jgi:hypothetical protein
MSILLLGARFPQNGSPLDCTIRKDGRSIISYETGTGIMRCEDFTAIELPPHGRLIDAYKLESEILSEDGKNHLYCYPCVRMIRAIKDAPTIIESEHVRCG